MSWLVGRTFWKVGFWFVTAHLQLNTVLEISIETGGVIYRDTSLVNCLFEVSLECKAIKNAENFFDYSGQAAVGRQSQS